MTMGFRAALAALFLAVAVGAPVAALAQDKVETATASFAAIEGWKQSAGSGFVRFTAPEGDVDLYVVDAGEAADSAAATLAAWKLVDPGFAREVRIATAEAAAEGWEEGWATRYEVSPEEKLGLIAISFRHGKQWTLLLARGALATFGKRQGQLIALYESLRPRGYIAENFAGKPALPLDASRRAALKAFWQHGMRAYGVPGMAYAFIDRDGIVEEGGLGVRALGKPEPVDAHTRFMIASNTKGMTTLLMARLVDAGKLAWDEPVVKVDPAFRLGDPATRDAILIRHLICACTGMPRQDLEWIMTGNLHTPADRVFDLLAPMKPTSKFGEVYQYSNLLASAAGYVAGHVAYPGMETGAAYDKAMQAFVFAPLGMRDTVFERAAAERGNHAEPHALDVDGVERIDSIDKSDSIYFARPAGGAWSSAHDLALYALNELRGGLLPGGKRLVSEDALMARRLEGMTTGEATSYGMGLETTSRWGVPMVHHGGAMPGYKTDWVILPEAGIGIVMLFNSEDSFPLLDATRRRLVELLYGGHEDAADAVAKGAAALRHDLAQARTKISIPPDPVAVAKLATHYQSPELGSIVVRPAGADLTFDFGSFSSRMATKRNADGSTSFQMLDATVAGWTIDTRGDGDRYELVMRDAQHEYVYKPVQAH